MTATVLSHLPLQAGSALVAGAGRVLRWGIAHYARAPLANTCVLALTVFTAMAGSNALYFQHGRHPAPLFSPAPDLEIGLPSAVTPANRKNAQTVPSLTEETPRPAPIIVVEQPRPIGNAAVIELQRKLTTLGLYDGKVDGVFGPKTSGAVRRFEERTGLPPKGELTPDILETIARAPIVLQPQHAELPRPLAVEPIIIVDPPAQPEALAVQELAPSPQIATAEITGSIPPAGIPNPAAPEDAFQPLPAPAPLELTIAGATQPAPLVAARRDLPDTPREVLNIAVATARNGIEALASVIENGPQLGPTPRPIAQIAPLPATQSVQVAQPEPEPEPVAQLALQPMPPMPEVAAPPADAPMLVADIAPVVDALPAEALTDHELIVQVQRGLTSLGFLRAEIDGVAGEATAKAIRNFEVYYNYQVTGKVTPGLVSLLVSAGAQI